MSRIRTATPKRPPRVPPRKSSRIPVADSDFSASMYDRLSASDDFDEPLRGLSTRELLDEVVFQHYFGSLP